MNQNLGEFEGISGNPPKYPLFPELWGWGILRDLDSGIFGDKDEATSLKYSGIDMGWGKEFLEFHSL